MQATDDLIKPSKLGALSLAKLIRSLLDGPCSVPDLQVASGLSKGTLHAYMRALRKEHAVHICAWEKDATGRESLRIFKLGDGNDCLRGKKSKAQIARECRMRKQDKKLSWAFSGVVEDACRAGGHSFERPTHRQAQAKHDGNVMESAI